MTVNVYTPSLPMVVGATYTIPIFLLDYSTPQIVKTSPTVEAGDAVLFRKASGTWSRIGNLTTVPALIGISTKVLLLTILDTEIPAGTQAIAVLLSDQTSPATWCDLLIVKDVEAAVTVSSFNPVTDTVVNVTNVANVTGDVAGDVQGDVFGDVQGNLTGDVFGDVQGNVLGIVVVGDKTGFSLSATGIDAIIDEIIEGTTTFRQMMRLIASVLFGKSTGGGTPNPKFRDLADTKDRISATTDVQGNRTAITRDAT